MDDDTAPDNGGIETSAVEEETNESTEETRDEQDHGYKFPDTATSGILPTGSPDNSHPEPQTSSLPESVVSRPHLDDHQDTGSPIYFDLPEYLADLAPAKKIQYNPGRGLCLYISTGQQESFDPKKLKKYAKKKMIEWFVHVKKSFIYPFNITVGSGNSSYQKPIHHQYQFFDFLRSDEAEHAYNTGEPEIIILATIINQPITLLMYKLQGLPRDTPLEERCRIQTFNPIQFLMRKNKYVMKEDVFLLYEDNVHFSLLVDKFVGIGQSDPDVEDEVLPANAHVDQHEEVLSHNLDVDQANEVLPAVDPDVILPRPAQTEFVDNLFSSMFPGENVPTSEDEFADVLNKTQSLPESEGDFIPVRTSSTDDTTSTIKAKRKQSDCDDVEGLKKKHKDASVSGDEECTLRRSNRIIEKTSTLDRLLKPPSKTAQKKEFEKERHFSRVHKKINDRRLLHEREVAKLDEAKETSKRRKEIYEKETEELILLGAILRKDLTADEIKKIFNDNIQFFEDVKSGIVKNWRHTLYVSPGNSSPQLRSSMVGPPFTDIQQDIIYDLAKQVWLKDADMHRENNCYVSFVLLPTIFIRIYQVFMGLKSLEEAERRINNVKASIHHDEPSDSI